MPDITQLNRAKKNQNNEFYTTEYQAEYIIKHIGKYFKNKTIYCPCDTIESEIVKSLIRHKDEYQIKDILYTSDDYYSHLDLYEKCDIVYTNPPFTREDKYMKFLEQMNKKYILFASIMTIRAGTFGIDRYLITGYESYGSGGKPGVFTQEQYDQLNDFHSKLSMFKQPDGTYKAVNYFLMTNTAEFSVDNKQLKDNKQIKHKYEESITKYSKYVYYHNDQLYVDYATYLPINYKDEFWINVNAYLTYKNDFELVKYDKQHICKDGKVRAKVLVKLKEPR